MVRDSRLRLNCVVQFHRVTLIGLGLLGGSLGLALRRRYPEAVVTGVVRRPESKMEALQREVVNEVTTDLERAVTDADLVLLCTPVGQMRPLAQQMLAHVRTGSVVTDVGSAKADVVRDLDAVFETRGIHFVGGHPMAGGEQTGMSAARADLFDGAVCVVTPTARTNREAVNCIAGLWRSFGSRVLEMDPIQHDRLVGRSSHLPHIAAAALAGLVLSPDAPSEQSILCASGFRDTTRIASGSPEMWRDILLANRSAVAGAIQELMDELARVRMAVATGDGERLEAFFVTAKQRRDRWLSRHPAEGG